MNVRFFVFAVLLSVLSLKGGTMALYAQANSSAEKPSSESKSKQKGKNKPSPSSDKTKRKGANPGKQTKVSSKDKKLLAQEKDQARKERLREKKKQSRQRKKERQVRGASNTNDDKEVGRLADKEGNALVPVQYALRTSGSLTFPNHSAGTGKIAQGKFGGGWSLGVALSTSFTKIPNKWRFQPEINFGLGIQPKVMLMQSTDRTYSEHSLSYYYFQFPLLVSYQLLDNLRLYAGLPVYFLLDVVYDDGISFNNAVNNFNLGLTAGLQYALGNRFSLEMRYNHDFLPAYSAQKAAYPFTNTSFILRSLEIGIKYSFKGAKKITVVNNSSVGDLYVEGDILNLSKSEDPNGDEDGDGIPYYKDACPSQQGSAWNNGCPPDDDRDGVPNDEDSCKLILGAVNNFGCPADDKDRDGIIDLYDKCPSEKGPASNKGCPIGIVSDSANSLIAHKAIERTNLLQYFSSPEHDRLVQLLSVNFFDKNTISFTTEGKKNVDSIAYFMKAKPNLHCKFFGFTKSIHGTQWNKRMSFKRVGALKKALLTSGIPSDRISVDGLEDLLTLGKGSRTPITTLRVSLHHYEPRVAPTPKSKESIPPVPVAKDKDSSKKEPSKKPSKRRKQAKATNEEPAKAIARGTKKVIQPISPKQADTSAAPIPLVKQADTSVSSVPSPDASPVLPPANEGKASTKDTANATP